MGFKIRERNIYKDGKHFFYLADTCWSAFTNIEDDEWVYYLNLRRQQGFNTLQINILPQWDASKKMDKPSPFIRDVNGNVDFNKFNEGYFKRSRQMCEIAKEFGFELSLVALWSNYVPDTWASKMEINEFTLPIEYLKPYSEMIHKYFGDLVSFYMVSGDTDFSSKSTEYYVLMSKLLRDLAPNTLQTMHIKGRYDYLPDEIVELVDLYFYQSGHNSSDLSMPYTLAQTFYEKYPEKPVINSEPCYEHMGYSRGVYGRWDQKDVRRAAWQSVLSGAFAGVTYGASGIYSWHRAYGEFDASIGEAFDMPNSWNDALTYPGAWDYGYIKYLLETYEIQSLTPANELLVVNKEGVRIGVNESKILLYAPHNTTLKLNQRLEGYRGWTIDLDKKNVSPTRLSYEDEQTIIHQHTFLSDVLIILYKEKE